MKICYLANLQSVLLQRDVRYFASKGYQISILSYHSFPSDLLKVQNLMLYSLINQKEVGHNECAGKSFLNQKVSLTGHIFRKIYRFVPGDVATLLDMEIYAYRAREIIKQIRPDIVHGHFLSHYGYIAARTGFKPLIVTAMGDDVLVRPKESLLMKWTMLYSARKAYKIRTTSKAITEQMIRYGVNAEKIATFPRGVNLNIFRPSRSSKVIEKLCWGNKKILIMVRNFYSPICGHEYFILALPEVIRQEPETRVILVGSGQLESKYRQMVYGLGLNGHVYFPGEVNEIGVSEYLNSADIYVTSSLSDGTSNALLEAMACGLPVVVSDAPANLEWVKDGENGFITPRKDPQALAERLLSLLRDEPLRKRMGEQNFHIAQRRANREFYFNQLWNIYQNLDNNRKAR